MAVEIRLNRTVGRFKKEKLSPVESVYSADTETRAAGPEDKISSPGDTARRRWSPGWRGPRANDPVDERGAAKVIVAAEADEDKNLAFEQIHQKYHEKIFNLILRLVGDREDAEDLTVETFVNAYRSWGRFRGDAKVSTWLHQIAVNNCKNRFKQKDRQREREPISLDDSIETDSGELSREVADWRTAPEQMLMSKEFAEQVRRAVDALPMDYRMVLLLEQEDHSYEEIARITNLSVPAVKTRLHRARIRVRQRLEPYYRGWMGRSG